MNIPFPQFTKRIPIDVPAQMIYQAWSTQSGLESWFLREAVFKGPDGKEKPADAPIHKGDQYRWRWHGHPDSVEEKKSVIEANGRDFLSFSFSGDCIVSVTIKHDGQMNICELVQSNFPADEDEKAHLYTECGTGWTFYLTNLKSVLEGGLDLRNRSESIENVISS